MKPPTEPALSPLQQTIVDAFLGALRPIDWYRFCIMDWSLYDRCIAKAGHETPAEFHFYETVGYLAAYCMACGFARRQNPSEVCARCGALDSRLKSGADTNMVKSCCLPAPEKFSLNKSLFFLFSDETHADDRRQLLDNYFWELRLGQRHFAMGPLAQFPNVCKWDSLELKPITTPIDDPDLKRRNERWIDLQPDLRQLNFHRARPETRDLTVPVVFDDELFFRMDVVGRPFTPKSDINFMAVMEGLAAMGVQ